MQSAGFDALDFSATIEEYNTDVHDKDYYIEIKKYALDKGMCFNQAHAPYPSSYKTEEQSEEAFKKIKCTYALRGTPFDGRLFPAPRRGRGTAARSAER